MQPLVFHGVGHLIHGCRGGAGPGAVLEGISLCKTDPLDDRKRRLELTLRVVHPIMRATLMYGAGDVRVETVPDARLVEPTDALVDVTHACICGSDLWPYKQMQPNETGRRMGHEFIGIVEAVGAGRPHHQAAATSSSRRSPGRTAPASSASEGLQTSCLHGGGWGSDDVDGGQGEAVRVPQADGTLVVAPGRRGRRADALAAHALGRDGHRPPRGRSPPGSRPGKTVAVVGDGAVGLCGVIAARRLGAEQIIILGRHPDRIALAREFGATDVVSERGDEAIERVRELTGGLGVHSVLECVGYEQSMVTALGIARPGGAVGRVGVPQRRDDSGGAATFFAATSRSPAARPRRAPTSRSCCRTSSRAASSPAACSTATIDLDGVPDGYRAMNERESIKVHDRA